MTKLLLEIPNNNNTFMKHACGRHWRIFKGYRIGNKNILNSTVFWHLNINELLEFEFKFELFFLKNLTDFNKECEKVKSCLFCHLTNSLSINSHNIQTQ